MSSLYKSFDRSFRSIKREVNLSVLKVPEIEQKTLDATSNEPWGPHGQLLADIARSSYHLGEYNLMMNVLWKRMQDSGKNWRHVYKSLIVLEYIMTHGTERTVPDLNDRASFLQGLLDFQYVEPGGKDEGVNVRNKARALLDLLRDKPRIDELRERAVNASNKIHGYATSARGPSGKNAYGDFDPDRRAYGDEPGEGYRDRPYRDDDSGRDRDYGDDGYGRNGGSGSRDDPMRRSYGGPYNEESRSRGSYEDPTRGGYGGGSYEEVRRSRGYGGDERRSYGEDFRSGRRAEEEYGSESRERRVEEGWNKPKYEGGYGREDGGEYGRSRSGGSQSEEASRDRRAGAGQPYESDRQSRTGSSFSQSGSSTSVSVGQAVPPRASPADEFDPRAGPMQGIPPVTFHAADQYKPATSAAPAVAHQAAAPGPPGASHSVPPPAAATTAPPPASNPFEDPPFQAASPGFRADPFTPSTVPPAYPPQLQQQHQAQTQGGFYGAGIPAAFPSSHGSPGAPNPFGSFPSVASAAAAAAAAPAPGGTAAPHQPFQAFPPPAPGTASSPFDPTPSFSAFPSQPDPASTPAPPAAPYTFSAASTGPALAPVSEAPPPYSSAASGTHTPAASAAAPAAAAAVAPFAASPSKVSAAGAEVPAAPYSFSASTPPRSGAELGGGSEASGRAKQSEVFADVLGSGLIDLNISKGPEDKLGVVGVLPKSKLKSSREKHEEAKVAQSLNAQFQSSLAGTGKPMSGPSIAQTRGHAPAAAGGMGPSAGGPGVAASGLGGGYSAVPVGMGGSYGAPPAVMPYNPPPPPYPGAPGGMGGYGYGAAPPYGAAAGYGVPNSANPFQAGYR